VWAPNEPLPDDWDPSDLQSGDQADRYRFRILYDGPSPVQITPPTTVAMRLWINRSTVVQQPPPPPPQISCAKGQLWDPVDGKCINPPRLTTESSISETALWGAAVVGVGFGAYLMWKHLHKRRRR
jgi:hypothetical protein